MIDASKVAQRAISSAVIALEAQGVTVDAIDIVGRQRHPALTKARRYAAKLMRASGVMNDEDIAHALGRERSAISYLINGKGSTHE